MQSFSNSLVQTLAHAFQTQRWLIRSSVQHLLRQLLVPDQQRAVIAETLQVVAAMPISVGGYCGRSLREQKPR